MHSANLRQLEKRLYNQMPLIGECLRQRAAQALAQHGSPDAVRVLAKAIARSDDRQVLAIALDALRQIRKQECMDEVCAVWAVTRHNDLANLLINKGWVAFAPVDIKVLSALKVEQLEALKQGKAELVPALLQACQDTDQIITKNAQLVLRNLKNLEAQELLCCLVIDQDHQLAREVALERQYAPRDLNQRILFFFLTEQWEKYESLDYEHTILQKLYELGDEQLRKRIAHNVRLAGRMEWVQVIAGGRQGKRLGEMTDAEWETTLAVLSRGKHWEQMWELAQAVPPTWSVQLLRKLKDAGWMPKVECAELVQMGQKCVVDVPKKLNSLSRCHATLHGHINDVSCLAISPDGKLLASGSWDNTVRLWTSGLYRLSRLPIEKMSAEDMQWVQEALKDKSISEEERDWLEFIQALVHWQRRFDVEVEETPQQIDTREFDIEIEA